MDRSIYDVIQKHWNEAPVPVEAIIRELGIGYVEQVMGDQYSGALERLDSGKFRIVVNATDSAARKRFTAAHELGHYVYHRNLVGSGIYDNKAFRCTPGNSANPAGITQRHETEANQFAANLLMPSHLIKKLQAEGLDDEVRMARRLGVSVPAVRVRLGKPPYPRAEDEFERVAS